MTHSATVRIEAALSSSGFPASYFTNDPTYSRDDSPTSFDFNLLEKARNGSTENEKGGPMLIQPYTLDLNKYSAHSLTFGTTPAVTTLPPPGVASPAITIAMDDGSVKVVPKTSIKSDSNGPKSDVFARDRETSWIQPPPEAYLQAPHKETRSRKETPSLMTQATGTSTNSYSQAVITFARKNPFASATARTLMMNTMSSRNTPSPEETGSPRGVRPTIDTGIGVTINTVPQRRPTLVRTVNGAQKMTGFVASTSWETTGGTGQDMPPQANFPPQPDSYGRI